MTPHLARIAPLAALGLWLAGCAAPQPQPHIAAAVPAPSAKPHRHHCEVETGSLLCADGEAQTTGSTQNGGLNGAGVFGLRASSLSGGGGR